MKKRIASIILALVMLLSLLPTAAFAKGGSHSHNEITFSSAWEKTDSLPAAANLIDDVGSFYLTDDVTLSATWNVPQGTVNLCLNGYTVTWSAAGGIEVGDGATLNIYDCKDTVHYGHIDATNHLWVADETVAEGNVSIFGGSIRNGALNYQGFILPFTANIHIAVGGAMSLNGGNIVGFNSDYGGVKNEGALTVTGGCILGNNGSSGVGYGGGVYNTGKLEISGGKIAYNYAYRFGGGVYSVVNSATTPDSYFRLTGGTISNNKAAFGGGIYSMADEKAHPFELLGGIIEYNSAIMTGVTPQLAAQGGGINNVGNMIIGGGTVQNNYADAGCENIYSTPITLGFGAPGTVAISEDGIAAGTQIGLSASFAVCNDSMNGYLSNAKKSDLQYFTAPDGYRVQYLDITKELRVIEVPAGNYLVNIDACDCGDLIAPDYAEPDAPVTVTVEPEPGHQLKKLTYTPEGGVTTEIKADDTGVYSFTMPESDVTLAAEFEVDYLPCTHGVGDSHDETWTGTTTLPTTAGKYYLTGDVTLTEPWSAPEGTTELCLNDYTITWANDITTKDAYNAKDLWSTYPPYNNLPGNTVIRIPDGATLNICDCNNTEHYGHIASTEGMAQADPGYYKNAFLNDLWIDDETKTDKNISIFGGSIRGGYTVMDVGNGMMFYSPIPGSIVVDGGGKLALHGGNIVGCKAGMYGLVFDRGSFTMTDGTILGNGHSYVQNNATYKYAVPSAVYAVNMTGKREDGFFRLAGGRIAYNAGNGANIYPVLTHWGYNEGYPTEYVGETNFKWGGNFEISGGMIDHNKMGGVQIAGGAVIGGGRITDNIPTGQLTANDVMSSSGAGIRIAKTGLADGTRIGLTIIPDPITNADKSDKQYFFADYPSSYVAHDADKRELSLQPIPVGSNKISVQCSEGGTVTVDEVATPTDPVTFTVSVDKGYQLKSLTVSGVETSAVTDNRDGTYTFNMPNDNVTVTAEFEEAAVAHTHDDLTFEPWESNNSLPGTNDLSGGVGSYYLTKDVELDEAWEIPEGCSVNLCLNGHVIKPATDTHCNFAVIQQGAKLNLYDCNTRNEADRTHAGYVGADGLWILGSKELYDDGEQEKPLVGGIITGFSTGQYETAAGAIYVDNNAELSLNGGYIAGNDGTEGGGVYVNFSATFNMNGGTIFGNTAVYGGGVKLAVNDSGVGACMRMTDGAITANVAKLDQSGLGGGVYMAYHANLIMTGGTISKNRASKGGGIYSASESNNSYVGNLMLLGGTITENSAANGGGGVWYDKQESGGCVAAGTMVTLADGSRVPVETLKTGDLLRVFDHETGTYTCAPLAVLYKYEESKTNAYTLHFSGNVDITLLGRHSFFEESANNYVVFSRSNAESYIGQSFYDLDNGCWRTLESVTQSAEATEAYALFTAKYVNQVTEGMLSCEAHIAAALCNPFELDQDMKIIPEKRAADIARWGLLTFDEQQFVNKATFEAFPVQYLNIAIGKGLTSLDEMKWLVDTYGKEAGISFEHTASKALKSSNAKATKPLMLLEVPSFEACSGCILGGSIQITGNETGDANNNFYLEGPATCKLGTGAYAPTDEMSIGLANAGDKQITENAGLENDTALTHFSFDVTKDPVEKIVRHNGDIWIVTQHDISNGCTQDNQGENNGYLSVDENAYSFSDVTVTVTPNDGYQLGELTVTDGDGQSVTVGEGNTFTMPTSDVTVTAEFEQCPGHTHDDLTFQPWESNNSLPAAANLNDGVGNYYLTADVTLSSAWTVPSGTVNLCLNGHVLNLNGKNIQVLDGSTLNLYDCNEDSKAYKFTVDGAGLWSYVGEWQTTDAEGDTTKKVTGGVITGGSTGTLVSGNSCGGAIFVKSTSSATAPTAFNMYGGTIAGNTTGTDSNKNIGGGVYVLCDGNATQKSIFHLYGGTICGNTAYNGGGIYISTKNTAKNSAEFTMDGGIVAENKAAYCGGGIYFDAYNNGAYRCVSTINGGKICGNRVKGATNAGGAGIYDKLGFLTITGGEIAKNTADGSANGAGLYLMGSTCLITGGTINNNTLPNTQNKGAGIYSYYNGSKTFLTITGGSITGNKLMGTNTIGGGIYAYNTEIKLGGSAVVKDNYRHQIVSSDKTPVRSDLSTDGTLALGTGTEGNGVVAPSEGMAVGIDRGVGQFTTNGKEIEKQYFFADDAASYHVDYNDGGYLELLSGPSYEVIVGDMEHGAVSSVKPIYNEGESVKLTSTPDEGYMLDTLTVTDGDGQNVAVGEGNTFTMPASNVTVTATFCVAGPTIKVAKAKDAGTGNEVANPVYNTASSDLQLFTVTTKNFESEPTLKLQWQKAGSDPVTWDGIAPTGVTLDTDGKVSTSADTPAGNYIFRIVTSDFVEGNSGYSSGPITLTVDKAPGSASVSMTGWTYGGAANNPSPTSSTNDTTSVTYQYKVSTAGDDTYSNDKPTSAGTYTVKATFAATANYAETTATANFTISKATLTANDFSFTPPEGTPITYDGNGKEATVAFIPGTDPVKSGCGKVTVKYAKKTGESTWDTAAAGAPTDAGTYKVSIFVAEGDNYNATSSDLTKDGWTFTISKADYADTFKRTASGNLKATSGSTVEITLPAKPEGASYGTAAKTTDADKYTLSAISGDKITATSTGITAGGDMTFTVPVTPDGNHNGYTITVTITPVFKTEVSVSGVSMNKTSYTYGDTVGYTGTPAGQTKEDTPQEVSITSWTYTYYKDTSTTETPNWVSLGATAPTDAGSYKLVVEAVDPNYEGKQEIEFTIAKKTVKLIWAEDNFTYDGTDQKSKITVKFVDNAGQDVSLGFGLKVINANGGAKVTFKDVTPYGYEATVNQNPDTNNALGANYQLPEEISHTYHMKPKALTAEVTATKVYDGTTVAAANQVTATVATGIDGETLTISGVTGTFNSANVADCTTVTPDGTGMSVTAGQNTNKANYEVSLPQSGTGTITAFDLSGATVTLNKTEVSYTGNPITSDITVTVKDSNNNVIPSTDYKITYTNNTNAAASTDTNAPTVTIAPADSNTNVTGEISEKFTITKAQTPPAGTPTSFNVNAVTGNTLSLSDIGVTLAGAEITNVAAVSGKTGKVINGAPTKAGDGKSISWTTVAQPSGTESDQYTLTVSSDNYEDFTVTVSFTGKIVVTFDESAKPVNGGDPITYGTDYTVSAPAVSDGQETPTVNFTYTYYENAGTTESPDWKKLETKPTDAGDYKVEISVNDNKYTGSKEYEYTIAKKQVEVIWGDTALAYDPAAGIKTPSATYQLLECDGSGTPDLTVTTDATNTNAGTFTASAAFSETDALSKNYELAAGTATKQYTVSPKAVAPAITLTPAGEKKYTGSPVTFTAAEIELKDGSTVIPATEYTVSYQNNTNAGTAILIITDKEGGNYTVSGQTTFTIAKAARTTAPAAPTVSGSTVTIAAADREKKLEYSLDGENAWISVPTLNGNNAFTLSGLTVDSHTIYLREKESSNYFASSSVSKTFELTQYSVAYNANGGVGSIASQTANSGSDVTVKSGSGFSRTGYTFNGWKDENGISHAVGSTVSTGMTLYAQWTANSYTVQFNANGGSGTMANESFTYDTAKALTTNAFTRTDYSFVGWATSANGPVMYSDAQSVKNLAGSGTVTLYAVWAQNVYSINVNITSPQEGSIKVKLQQGNAVYAVADSAVLGQNNGLFIGVPAGTYNIEVTQTIGGDKNVTMTQLVVLTNNADVEIALPESGVNSKLEVEEDTLPTVVGGLDEEAESNRQTGKDITVTMTVEKQEEQQLAATADEKEKETQAAISEIKAEANGRALDFMNIEIKKETKDASSGESISKEAITETSSVLELVFSFEMNGKKNIQIYRQHGDAVQTFMKLDTKPTTGYEDGKFYVDTANSLIYVYASSFSTYAIGYEEEQDDPYTPYTPVTPTYTITGADTENGKLTISRKNASAGQTVTITVKPDEGYKLNTLTVKDITGKELTLTKVNDTTYTFKMPIGKVTVSATFTEVKTVCPQDETCVYAKFTDADTTAWYHDGVHFCVENGYMQGVSTTAFDPSGTTTRAMIVTMLWRMEGEPVANYAMSFKDVKADRWYTEAIRWAQSTGVVEGYSAEAFGPNDPITREQMATILYRYAKYHEINVANTNTLAGFTDVNKVSAWALDAMKWANAVGLVQGRTTTTLVPEVSITRAEAATMVQRYCEKVCED